MLPETVDGEIIEGTATEVEPDNVLGPAFDEIEAELDSVMEELGVPNDDPDSPEGIMGDAFDDIEAELDSIIEDLGLDEEES